MRSCFVIPLMVVLLFALQASATVRRVSANGVLDYQTITAAYNASAAGDTILVNAGGYDAVTINRRTTILGAGLYATGIGAVTFQSGAAGSVLEGVSISVAAVNFTVQADSIFVRRCHLTSNGSLGFLVTTTGGASGKRVFFEDCILRTGIYQGVNGTAFDLGSDTVVVRNCVITRNHNQQTYNHLCFQGVPRTLSIINCVFLDVLKIFNYSTGQLIFINNVVYDWAGTPDWGTYPVTPVFSYNAASSSTPPGEYGTLLTSNPFVNYNPAGSPPFQPGVSDLHLVGGSPCIDGGLPSWLDLDASRSDMGIYGCMTPFVNSGAPAYPFTVSATSQIVTPQGDSLHFQSSGRVGPRY